MSGLCLNNLENMRTQKESSVWLKKNASGLIYIKIISGVEAFFIANGSLSHVISTVNLHSDDFQLSRLTLPQINIGKISYLFKNFSRINCSSYLFKTITLILKIFKCIKNFKKPKSPLFILL